MCFPIETAIPKVTNSSKVAGRFSSFSTNSPHPGNTLSPGKSGQLVTYF